MKLADLAVVSSHVAATRSRSNKIAHLCDALRRFSPEEVAIGAAYLIGELPQGRIGVGAAMLDRAMPHAAREAAEPELELVEVDAVFSRIAATTGPGSTSERERILGALLERASREEQRFLLRLILGELRQGALEGIMVEAVARAAGVDVNAVRRAAMLEGRLPAVALAALVEGAEGLERFRIELLRPVKPMLAESAGDLEDALTKLGSVALELKLDGARVQIHKAGDEIRVFSRRLNDVTLAVPELVDAARSLRARAIVVDGEAIALHRDGTPRPFQTTMRRFGRRLDVSHMRDALPLTVFFFDCLHLDGEDLVDTESEARFAALREATGDDLREAQGFYEAALERGHEGVMAKSLTAPYAAGRRGSGWLKVKSAHTLDLVVLAAEWGHGRRRGYLSNLHLGARDPESGGFVMLGKTFKGLTDRMLAWQTGRLQDLEIARDARAVHVRPELVVEVAFNDIQTSRRYRGGLALRFARVKRYRTDKSASQADTIERVRELHAPR